MAGAGGNGSSHRLRVALHRLVAYSNATEVKRSRSRRGSALPPSAPAAAICSATTLSLGTVERSVSLELASAT